MWNDLDEPVFQVLGTLQACFNVLHGLLRYRDAFAINLADIAYAGFEVSIGHAPHQTQRLLDGVDNLVPWEG